MNFAQKTGATFVGGIGLLASAFGLYEAGRSNFSETLETQSKLQFEKGLQQGHKEAAEQQAKTQIEMEKRLRSEAKNEAVLSLSQERTKLVEEAEKNGFERGVLQTKVAYQDSENQTRILANIISLVQSPAVKDALPKDTNESIAVVAKNIESGDFQAAAAALPAGVELAAKDQCLDLSAGNVVLTTGQSFDTCEFGNFVAVKSAHFNGYMTLSVDGKEVKVKLFDEAKFNSQCVVLFRAAQGNGSDSKATLRFTCSTT